MRSAPNRFGQGQQATIMWMVVSCADTDNCSEPRQASGRTYASRRPFARSVSMQAWSISAGVQGTSKPRMRPELHSRRE